MSRHRVYFLVPDVETCHDVVQDLRQSQVPDTDIHVVARDDIPLEAGMHRASALQKTELSHGLEMGIGVGGMAGMLGGLLAVTFPPAGVVLGGGALILASTLAGAGFGTIVSALIAGDIPNHELERFQTAIDIGEILLIVDIPTPAFDAIAALVKKHHPEAVIGVTKAVAAPGVISL
jgi:hypothetical protein